MRASDYNTGSNGNAVDGPFAHETHGRIETSQPHHIATKGFAQAFGLHPGIAFLTLILDAMLFTGEAGTLGAFWPISVGVAAAFGIIVYKAQMRWFGDDSENAAIKAGILALLTALPTPLPALIYIPFGIVGLFRKEER